MVRVAGPLALLVVLTLCLGAEAQPVPPGYWRGPPGYWGGPPRFGPTFYRFRRFGPYGVRPYFPGRLSYGTGYHGRGTATGGPAGGLPNRN